MHKDPINSPERPILIVDDEIVVLRTYSAMIRSRGFTNIITCDDSREVESLVDTQQPEVVILDLDMPNLSGQEVLEVLQRRFPTIPVIISTGASEVQTAVSCLNAGAFDYTVKPVPEDRLITTLTRAIDMRELSQENRKLKEHFLAAELRHPAAFKNIITRSKNLLAVFQYIEAIADSTQPVLVTGETGVGKELIARAIHDAGERKGKYVPVNVAGVDDHVFSDTLFGHVKGAFTGADSERQGLIEEAHDGTLFLDEIGDLTHPLQVKLLRLLQEGEFYPLGSDKPKRAHCRIVVATNRNLLEHTRTGHFREDLYYRLWSHHIELPALRNRTEDLPLLIDHFLAEAATSLGKRKPTPPRELLTLMSNYAFPGNIRELRAIVLDAVSRHRAGVMSMDAFREAVQSGLPANNPNEDQHPSDFETALKGVHPLPTFRQAEDLLIAEALRRSDRNQTIAAQLLGTTRQTLNRRLKLINNDDEA